MFSLSDWPFIARKFLSNNLPAGGRQKNRQGSTGEAFGGSFVPL